ncbi:MAG: NAD(P)H-dependent glycerol-3-phosphate dehydrogenase [Chitinophagales bacterium]|nr:NAD(P)H-dependent glycerol-3-phosphate dehydrogenase [Chitinophagales bacterium]
MGNTGIAMIGGGSWATALVKVLNQNQHHVHWWIRNQAVIDCLKKENHNPDYLSGVKFSPAQISPSNNLEEIFSKAEIIFLAVPSAYIKNVLQKLSPANFQNKIFISAIKGMIPQENLLIAEFLEKEFSVPEKNIINISGPSHAEEVALEKLSYLTLACTNEVNAKLACDLLACKYVRCSTSDDVEGTEYSAVLKNIYAIAAGVFHGLGYGDNFHAVLISNCIEEMERFLKAVHPITRDIKDSAYLGDLLVTAYSQFSRNRTLGAMIGKGYSVKNALLEMNMVAEGYYAAKCVHEINAQHHINIPIVEAVYEILYEEGNAEVILGKVTKLLS